MSFGWGFGGVGMNGNQPSRFEEQYHCYSVAYADKAHLEAGDKILLPPSALDTLCRLQVDYPMLFRLQSSQKGTMTHCGVLEFTAEEGSCYIPFWMMQNLLIEEGSVISVANVSLPKATFVKLQPQHVDFLEITNPRAVLERALRKFSCVTKGNVICLPYNDKNYHFELKEVQPQDAACIIETDCNVDFDAPVGYKDPSANPDNINTATTTNNTNGNTSINTFPSTIQKQSAYADKNANGNGNGNNACPSPTPSSMSGASSTTNNNNTNDNNNTNSLRIVDGKIIRPNEEDSTSNMSSSTTPDTNQNMNPKIIDGDTTDLASKNGTTGVQNNSAIAIKAPKIDYWAVDAGDGARLDGKIPTKLLDKDGAEVDVRKLRAEAAAKRMKKLNESMGKMPSVGSTVEGKKGVKVDDDDEEGNNNTNDTNGGGDKKTEAPVSKRKSRIGSKYSRLKQSGGFAFQGSANTMKK